MVRKTKKKYFLDTNFEIVNLTPFDGVKLTVTNRQFYTIWFALTIKMFLCHIAETSNGLSLEFNNLKIKNKKVIKTKLRKVVNFTPSYYEYTNILILDLGTNGLFNFYDFLGYNG